eukprot:Platyproteum_vivax@DN12576_c0_g1_i1.p1
MEFSNDDCKETSVNPALGIDSCEVSGPDGVFKLSTAVTTLNTDFSFATKINLSKLPQSVLKLTYAETTLQAEMKVLSVKGSVAAKSNAKGDEKEAVMLPVNITQNTVTELKFVFQLTTPISRDDHSLLVKLPANFTMAEKACDDETVAAKLENCASTCATIKVAAKADANVQFLCERLGKDVMRLTRKGTVDSLSTVRLTLKALSPVNKQAPTGPAMIYSCVTAKCIVPTTMTIYNTNDDYNDFGETKNINRNGALSVGIITSMVILLLGPLIGA